MAFAQTSNPFTAFGTNGPETSVINSYLASMSSLFEATRTAGIVAATTTAPVASVAPTVSSAATTAVPSRTSVAAATTLSTVPTSTSPSSSTRSTPGTESSSPLSPLSSSSSSNISATGASSVAESSATSAAQSTPGANEGTLSQQSSTCNSISCSAGLKAAVAVPIVIGVLGILALAAFLARRRKRKAKGDAQGMGRPEKNKRWTRHLRMFSFDAELLMGGRFSSTNSIRSGRSSTRVNTQSPTAHHHDPSVHSIEDAAPAYRDALSHAQPPNMTQMGPGMLAAGALARPVSSATAPPPYVSNSRQSNRPSTATSSQRNPFNDSTSGSPIEDSPFNDPDGQSTHTQSTLSRNSSLYHGSRVDDMSTPAESPAASIHEARVGRHVSVNSVGRTIQSVRMSQLRNTPTP